eukprot:417319-Alexandrium_andersonii.AAC.1
MWLGHGVNYVGYARMSRCHQVGASGPSYRWAEHLTSVVRTDLPDSSMRRYRYARKQSATACVFCITQCGPEAKASALESLMIKTLSPVQNG